MNVAFRVVCLRFDLAKREILTQLATEYAMLEGRRRVSTIFHDVDNPCRQGIFALLIREHSKSVR